MGRRRNKYRGQRERFCIGHWELGCMGFYGVSVSSMMRFLD
jgi:hypothetical protein